MTFPDFFDQVPGLTLRDPLADMLGAAAGGVIEYRYADAVKLAGHSCPTVAGAWLMARRALAALYPDTLPLRGGMWVELHAAQAAGTAGVVGSVLGLITGAAAEGGFKGLGGQHVRRDLLRFDTAMRGEARFTRIDDGNRVELVYHPERVPAEPGLQPLMQRVLAAGADAAERAEFGRLWQARVRWLLIEHADDLDLIEVIRPEPVQTAQGRSGLPG